jgi:carboxypeptidase T
VLPTVASRLLDNCKADPDCREVVENMDIWVVPVVNPDGYDYSRSHDLFWRKNRKPLYSESADAEILDKAMRGQPIAYGVDLHRNSFDGVREDIYRPPFDKKGGTSDDFGKTSDDPRSRFFRGFSGASEEETRAMQNLELGKKNIAGVVDHHGFGRMILYPYGFTTEPTDRESAYRDVAEKMTQHAAAPYAIIPASELYLHSGSPCDYDEIHNKYALTLELGKTFQPGAEELKQIDDEVWKADLTFMKWILERKVQDSK